MVTCLIPTYNRASMLREAIASVKGQVDKVIVWDDGSQDETEKICRMLEVEYHKGEHRGVAYARNRLLEMVETPYACWQDSDDVSTPDRIVKQLAVIDNFDLIESNLWHCRQGLKKCYERKIDIRSYYTGDVKDMWGNMAFATSLFRKECARVKFDEKKTDGGEDVKWLRKLVEAGYRIGHVDLPLYKVRHHLGRMTVIRAAKRDKQELKNEFVALAS